MKPAGAKLIKATHDISLRPALQVKHKLNSTSTNMRITFLGTGTSVGVPFIGCKCEVCQSTDPHDQRLRASVLIEDETTRIVIDCGPDFRAQALRQDIDHLDAIIITHEHYDHLGGLDDVRPLGSLPIYAERRVLQSIRRNLHYCFGTHHYPGSPQLQLRQVIPNHQIRIGSFSITPLRIMHGHLPIIGYRIGDMAYLTDVKTIPADTLRQLTG
ncbi:MAG: MBL fold metallo-hydrolase, partial [Paludibacteraceae bacterium]|nr:MBL fold metallo-hydrolase [Paludibacteraceae bacterium]